MRPSSPLAPAEAEVLGAIDESWLLETLAGLIAVPSWDGRERRAQEYMATAMSDLGMDVDVWEIDEAEIAGHPDYATEIERRDPLGVVGRARWGEGGPVLVLNGHVDVVPPGDLSRWTTPPFEMVRQGGRVYGRGVVDMKGPLVAGLAGVGAVLASGEPLSGSVLFQSVVGEEDGGVGTLATVLRGHVGDGAVVLEPTGLSVAAAQAGALNFRLTVPGRAAHGALRYEGVSALEKFMLVYRDLVEFERERNRGVDDPRLSALPHAVSDLCGDRAGWGVGLDRAGVDPGGGEVRGWCAGRCHRRAAGAGDARGRVLCAGRFPARESGAGGVVGRAVRTLRDPGRRCDRAGGPERGA